MRIHNSNRAYKGTCSRQLVAVILVLNLMLLALSGCGQQDVTPTVPLEVVTAATEAAIMATKAAAHATLVAQDVIADTPTPEPTTSATSESTPATSESAPPTPESSTPEPPPTSELPTPTPEPIIVHVTNPHLNVREGPGTVYSVVTQVKNGDALSVWDRNSESTWIRIQTPDNQEGWVSAKYTDIGGYTQSLPVARNMPTPPPCRNGVRGLIAFKSSRGGIWVMNADGGNQMPMCNTGAYYGALNNKRSREFCSANGNYCAKDDWSPDRRHMDIYVQDNEYGTGWNRIVSNDHTDWGARIDSGGYWVVFVTNRNGNDELWMISREVTGERRLTINDWQWDKHPTWSPDGKRIAFFSNRVSGRKQIWMLDPNKPLKENVNPHNISRNSFVDSDPVWLK